ncbi:unnamed protein product [Protopolystoma xenopodis]|uniref:Uncharacterized protein n=1 Tax=Protopolystoma xenopodis TaxID=117903 RepID=A0A3S5B077_9PLAT|nr:unnamed protein product [Protopolystoma xenopodis]
MFAVVCIHVRSSSSIILFTQLLQILSFRLPALLLAALWLLTVTVVVFCSKCPLFSCPDVMLTLLDSALCVRYPWLSAGLAEKLSHPSLDDRRTTVGRLLFAFPTDLGPRPLIRTHIRIHTSRPPKNRTQSSLPNCGNPPQMSHTRLPLHP